MRSALVLLLLPVCALAAFAAERVDYARDLPPVKPREPREALATFRVEPGFRIEQVAAEPVIADPVEMAFDEQGRLWVLEFTQYNQEFPGGDPTVRGRLKVLRDTDGDGRMDTATTFAEGLNYASAFALWKGGVFVGETPDIVYLADTDGDGRADRREVVFTGFAREPRRAGHAQINSFRWGMDRRIHVCTNTGGVVSRPGVADQAPVDVRGRGFSFDPRTRHYDVRSGGGQHGMTFDAWGNSFACQSSMPGLFVIYDARYLAHNPWLHAPSPVVRIHPPLADYPLYVISPEEPWRVLRSKLRTAGQFFGQADTRGGTVVNQGFFTAATGFTIYTGDAFPAEYQGSGYIGEPASNVVHRTRLRRDGVSFIAEPTNAATRTEFLASSDNWFRPVQFANGPDGALYVADLYRELIEGGTFLPPEMLRHLGVVNGQDRGRIYRILPEEKRPGRPTDLGRLSTAELTQLLGHPNGWHRETAARLLHERHDPGASAHLRDLAARAPDALGRTQARHALVAAGAYTPELALAALTETDENALAHSLRLAEPFSGNSAAIRTRIAALTSHAAAPVRYQALFSLGGLAHPEKANLLVQALKRDGADRWMRLAALTGLRGLLGEVFRALSADVDFVVSDRAEELLRELAVMAAESGDILAITAVAGTLGDESARNAGWRRPFLQVMLAKGGPAARQALVASPDARIREEINGIVTSARQVAFDAKRPVSGRVAQLPLLELVPFAEVHAPLRALLAPDQHRNLQQAALALLARFEAPEVGSLVVEVWPGLSPALRAQAADVLLARPAWALACINALETGRLTRGELGSLRIDALRKHADPSVRSRARDVLGAGGAEVRDGVVARYRSALDTSGDPVAGRAIFTRVCAGCHGQDATAGPLGPNLTGIGRIGREPLLLNILDPNRDVKAEYVTYTLETTAGTTHAGMIQHESANSVTLRRMDGSSVDVLRVDIARLSALGVSFMPEGLEEQVSVPEMADLLSYLESLR
jgi:putative membrane-bound dehydrogenase-like protein